MTPEINIDEWRAELDRLDALGTEDRTNGLTSGEWRAALGIGLRRWEQFLDAMIADNRIEPCQVMRKRRTGTPALTWGYRVVEQKKRGKK